MFKEDESFIIMLFHLLGLLSHNVVFLELWYINLVFWNLYIEQLVSCFDAFQKKGFELLRVDLIIFVLIEVGLNLKLNVHDANRFGVKDVSRMFWEGFFKSWPFFGNKQKSQMTSIKKLNF